MTVANPVSALSFPVPAVVQADASHASEPDWKCLYERAEERAEAAEARAGELNWRLELAHRLTNSFLGSWKAKCGELEAAWDVIKRLLTRSEADNKRIEALEARNKELEAEVEQLRATGKTLSKGTFGKKSEKKPPKPKGGNRGQQPGKPGHGRTEDDNLPNEDEVLEPPESEKVCPCCGKPYAPNGSEKTVVKEIEVRAHTRTIIRNRYRCQCDCEGVPNEVLAPPPLRPIVNSPYGFSIVVAFLVERYLILRTLRGVAFWFLIKGLAISAGTLAGFMVRLLPLFAVIAEAIRQRLNASFWCHGDETSWRVQYFSTVKKNSRGWLWVRHTVEVAYFHIDPARSASAAWNLYEGIPEGTLVVCDRYAVYKKLAREKGLVLCFCWAHVRRDWFKVEGGSDSLKVWSTLWVKQISVIWKLNDARLVHYDPDAETQSEAFGKADESLRGKVEGLFLQAGNELEDLEPDDLRRKPLASLLEHRDGLCQFLDHPEIPLDNNAAERILRRPVISRRLSFGSDSEQGAKATAVMFSVVETLRLNDIPVDKWLESWLRACAANGHKPPDDISPWLPWLMSEEQKEALRKGHDPPD